MPLIIHNENNIDIQLAAIRAAATLAVNQLTALANNPFHLFWRMKYEPLGRHPIEDRELNLVEQINQTWTYVAALEASRILLGIHPGETFLLAPGAHAALRFDVVNLTENICAETFAAVAPDNNNKLNRDIAKLDRHPEIAHRYVFFISPTFPATGRLENREHAGIQIWSIACPQWVNEMP